MIRMAFAANLIAGFLGYGLHSILGMFFESGIAMFVTSIFIVIVSFVLYHIFIMAFEVRRMMIQHKDLINQLMKEGKNPQDIMNFIQRNETMAEELSAEKSQTVLTCEDPNFIRVDLEATLENKIGIYNDVEIWQYLKTPNGHIFEFEGTFDPKKPFPDYLKEADDKLCTESGLIYALIKQS